MSSSSTWHRDLCYEHSCIVDMLVLKSLLDNSVLASQNMPAACTGSMLNINQVPFFLIAIVFSAVEMRCLKINKLAVNFYFFFPLFLMTCTH